MKSVVLFVKNTALGGAELNQLAMLRALKDEGARVYLVLEEEGELHGEYEGVCDGILRTGFAYPGKLGSWVNVLRSIPRIKKFIGEIPGDVVLVTGDFYPLWTTLKVGRALGLPVYSIWQGEFSFSERCVKKWVRYGANEADKLIASPVLAACMNETGILKKRVESLLPHVDLSRFDADLYDREALREKYGLKAGDKVAICTGQVAEAKGQVWLVEHFLANERLREEWKLWIVGPLADKRLGEEHEFFKAKKAGNATWWGSRRDIPELLAVADLAIFPGELNESFGLTVVEAVMMGVPVLTTGSRAVEENLGRGYPGLFGVGERDRILEVWERFDEAGGRLKESLPRETLRARLCSEAWRKSLREIFLESGSGS